MATNLVLLLAMTIPASAGTMEPASFNETALPTIEIWYGDRQLFGRAGNPQPLVNVRGSVHPVHHIADATFRVNGGRLWQIAFGPDLHRLARRRDFTLEIERSQLTVGENEVQIRLRRPAGRDVSRDGVIL